MTSEEFKQHFIHQFKTSSDIARILMHNDASSSIRLGSVYKESSWFTCESYDVDFFVENICRYGKGTYKFQAMVGKLPNDVDAENVLLLEHEIMRPAYVESIRFSPGHIIFEIHKRQILFEQGALELSGPAIMRLDFDVREMKFNSSEDLIVKALDYVLTSSKDIRYVRYDVANIVESKICSQLFKNEGGKITNFLEDAFSRPIGKLFKNLPSFGEIVMRLCRYHNEVVQ